MSRKLVVGLSLIGFTNAMWFLSAQEFNTPKKTPQYSNAKQPAESNSPPIRAKPPVDRPPFLTDPATDEQGFPKLPTRLEPVNRNAAPIRMSNPDRVLATWIALDNQEEMALAEIGAERATNPEIRKYAKLLVDDHASLIDQLKPFAPEIVTPGFLNASRVPAVDRVPTPKSVALEPGVDPVTKRARQEASAKIAAEATRGPVPADEPESPQERAVVPDTNRDFNVEQLARELAIQRLASSRKMLGERRGVDFDRFFMAQQIVMHKAMRDKLIVYQTHVSPALADVLSNTEKGCDEHLAKAFALLRTLPGGLPTTAATAPVRSVVKTPAAVR